MRATGADWFFRNGSPFCNMSESGFTLAKSERLCNRHLIERLFEEGASVSAFPIRIVYRISEPIDGGPVATVLFSVSKKRFKRAVCRNRTKRQLREMYRHSSGQLALKLTQAGCAMTLSLVFCDSRLWTSRELGERFLAAMSKLSARIDDYVSGQNDK